MLRASKFCRVFGVDRCNHRGEKFKHLRAGSNLLSLLKGIPEASRVSPTIENRHNSHQFAIQLVVDRVGKTFGKGSVKATVGFGVDAGVKNESVDVGEEAVEKVGANALCLPFVKSVTFQ